MAELDPEIRALSIQQPWAWLIVNGFKDIENRTWRTHRRGPIYVHAGKGFDREGYDWVKQSFPEIPLPNRKEFELGGLVGQTEIVDCVQQSDSPWFSGSFGFVLKDSCPIDFVPLKGKLSFFRINS